MSSFWILLELKMMEVVVTNGAIRCAKCQWNCHHQQTNTQLFTGWLPCHPTKSVKALKENADSCNYVVEQVIFDLNCDKFVKNYYPKATFSGLHVMDFDISCCLFVLYRRTWHGQRDWQTITLQGDSISPRR